jgi:DNA (cytosine-5)-methyltransferase 1
MVHLDLCSGIGGFHLAAQWAGFQTVGFAEIEPFCCRLLEQKWPQIRNYGDLRHADFTGLRGTIDVLSAGVPCQPASLAGKRRGAGDDRWLWPAVLDVVESVKSTWCVFENPPGILTLGEFEGVLLRLAEIGYEVRCFCLPANAVGAKHRRQRVFIVANADSQGCGARQWQRSSSGSEEGYESGNAIVRSSGETLADANSAGRSEQLRPEPDGAQQSVAQCHDWRLTEPEFRRKFNGVSHWLDGIERLNENTKTSAREVLFPLWSDAFAEAIQWAIRGFDGISEKEILLGILLSIRACNCQSYPRRITRKSEEVSRYVLRELRNDLESFHSSHQWRSECEHCREPANALRDVPHERASSLLALRPNISPLVQGRVKNRSHRLKALGSSVVPQQAFPFFEAIAQVERGA